MTDIKEYGAALFLLAEEEGVADEVREDLLTLGSVINENPEYLKLINTPAVSKGERLALIDGALGGLNRYAVNTVKLLAERRLSGAIPHVIDEYLARYDAARGIERVEAVSALPLTETQLRALTSKLEGETGKTVIITNTVEPEILGGMKLRYSGLQLDGSLRTRLDELEKNLKNILI